MVTTIKTPYFLSSWSSCKHEHMHSAVSHDPCLSNACLSAAGNHPCFRLFLTVYRPLPIYPTGSVLVAGSAASHAGRPWSCWHSVKFLPFVFSLIGGFDFRATLVSLHSLCVFHVKTKWALLLVSSKNDVFTLCVGKQSDAGYKQCKPWSREGFILNMNHALAALSCLRSF